MNPKLDEDENKSRSRTKNTQDANKWSTLDVFTKVLLMENFEKLRQMLEFTTLSIRDWRNSLILKVVKLKFRITVQLQI